jgi:hypothetical protein
MRVFVFVYVCRSICVFIVLHIPSTYYIHTYVLSMVMVVFTNIMRKTIFIVYIRNIKNEIAKEKEQIVVQTDARLRFDACPVIALFLNSLVYAALRAIVVGGNRTYQQHQADFLRHIVLMKETNKIRFLLYKRIIRIYLYPICVEDRSRDCFSRLASSINTLCWPLLL